MEIFLILATIILLPILSIAGLGMTEGNKHRLFISIVALVLYSCSINSSHADNNATSSTPESVQSPNSTFTEGWYKTKWGMTIDEIRTVLKEDIKQVSAEYKKKYNTAQTHTITDFKIGKFTFDVYLTIDPQKGLAKVNVAKKGELDQYACFLELENALKKKYGNPSSTEENKIMGSKMNSIEWITQDTLIRLIHSEFRFNNKNRESTDIIYESRRDTGEEKL